ncbi:MAG: L,D-transpeptidase family protein [bacterium]|nr:L,D-transpeptidase family protein [bacterium]
MLAASGLATILLVVLPVVDGFVPELSLRLAISAGAVSSAGAVTPDPVARIYREREGAPLWLMRPDAELEIPALIDRFAAARAHGLNPAVYPLRRLREACHARGAAALDERADLDVLLTRTALDYVADLTGQRLRMPLPTDSVLAAPVFDLVAFVDRVATGPEAPSVAIEEAAPGGDDYAGLRVSLRQLRAVRQAGDWPLVPDGHLLRPGESALRVAYLRRRILGEAATPAGPAEFYDDVLCAAVRRFQGRHGLVRDGVVGARTIAALNVPVADRLRQVEFSLERLRCLPRDLGRTHVRVDVLQGRLTVVEGDSVSLRLRTIVGRPARPTPVLSSRITSLEINPVWNIPQVLARQDVLPKIVEDPSYLVERGIRVFRDWHPGAPELDPLDVAWQGIAPWNLAYKLQQRPGPNNPLGRIKFMFPNPYAVYIHDTPHTGRFAESERFFSSGCVRLEEPLRLAEALLGEGYTELADLLASGETTSVPLPRPVAVHLVYATAWIDDDGTLCFRDDVYGYAASSSRPENEPGLPVADGAGVDVDEIGLRVVADAALTDP